MTNTGQQQRSITALALGTMFVTAVIATPAAQAQTYSVLYSFRGSPDGANPSAGLVRDSAGGLAGTAEYGGSVFQFGVVFKLNKTGETVLYSFTGGADGDGPNAGLIQDSAGNIYGTTGGGGASGWGVVFKLDTTGTETVLYSFTGGADGGFPDTGLIRDSAGNLYGTTFFGGIAPGEAGNGVVFKLDTTGTETVLHSFTGGADGAHPNPAYTASTGGLIRDSAGNLYGTTGYGGTAGACSGGGGYPGCGVVFKLDTTDTETVLYSFKGETDGANPNTRLIRDSAGNLYGTTFYGGIAPGAAAGYGVVFKVDTTGTETVLHRFTGGADGGWPLAGVIRDSEGNLYGTTSVGGIAGCGHDGCGVVFKLDRTGTETVLYSFTGGADGANPYAGLIRDSAGNLYGTAFNGGITECFGGGCGVVFKLEP